MKSALGSWGILRRFHLNCLHWSCGCYLLLNAGLTHLSSAAFFTLFSGTEVNMGNQDFWVFWVSLNLSIVSLGWFFFFPLGWSYLYYSLGCPLVLNPIYLEIMLCLSLIFLLQQEKSEWQALIFLSPSGEKNTCQGRICLLRNFPGLFPELLF